MKFAPQTVDGAYAIEQERIRDTRGFFARAFCRDEFQAHGLAAEFVQWNVSWNEHRGTLRGLHYQAAPFAEAKLVMCTRGAIWDVIIDVRTDSPTYGRWTAVTLTADEGQMVYVPAGCAHGYQALESGSQALYGTSVGYRQDAERGIRWNDPAFGISWPIADAVLSPKDRAHPDFALAESTRGHR